MDTEDLEQELHVSRYIIVYKFVLGLIELLMGLGIIFFSDQIVEIYINLTTKELIEDPNDLLLGILQKIFPYLLEHRGWVVVILIALGIVKIVSTVGLAYRKHWGLDLLVGLTVSLLPFQTYNLIVHPSLLKTIFFLINILIALYLVEFKPKHYFKRLKHRVKRKRLKRIP